MELKDFLDNQARKAELQSLSEFSEDKYTVKVSSYIALATRVMWIQTLLNDLYAVEEKSGEFFLKEKFNPINHHL